MKPVVLDLRAFDQAHDRLAEIYRADALAGQLSDQSLIEIDSSIRAARAALDKLINGLHEIVTGRRSRSLYFPWSEERLAKLTWMTALPPEVGSALQASLHASRSFPAGEEYDSYRLMEGGDRNPIPLLPTVYRSAGHHGDIEYTETKAPGFYAHDADGIPQPGPVMESGVFAWALVPPPIHFRGVPVTFSRGPGWVEQGFADFKFRDLDQSVMGYLIDLNNKIVELYQPIAVAMGWDPDEVRGFQLFYKPQPED